MHTHIDIYLLYENTHYNKVLPYPRLFCKYFGLPVNILKEISPSPGLYIYTFRLNVLDLIKVTVLYEGTNYQVSHCEAFPTPQSRQCWYKYFCWGSVFKQH